METLFYFKKYCRTRNVVSGPQKGELCGAFLRNRQQDVAGNERRRRGKRSQEGGAWNGESYPRSLELLWKEIEFIWYNIVKP